jgi:hypothetical protein
VGRQASAFLAAYWFSLRAATRSRRLRDALDGD